MKTFVLITALISTPAMAESIAWMQNQAGGNIVLTDEPCIFSGKDYKQARKMTSYAPGMPIEDGCWGIYTRNSDMVFLIWEDSRIESKVFNIIDFTWKHVNKPTIKESM